LIAAGAAAFAEEGLDVPSLDSICERAGFTRGAFYVHFADRSEFIAAVMNSLTSRFMDSMFGAGAHRADLTETVTRFAQAVSAGKYPLPGAVRLHHVLEACSRVPAVRVRRASLYREAMDRVGAAVQDGQQRGHVRRDVDPGQVGALMVAIVLGIEVLTEIEVPFGTMGAAATMLDLLRSTAREGGGQAAPAKRRRRAR
jgi:AcrR family transcriptional regulator